MVPKDVKMNVKNGVTLDPTQASKVTTESLAEASKANLASAAKYKGLVGTTRTIIAEEGARTLFSGLTAGLHRQILFSGIRVGLYPYSKQMVCGDLPEGVNPALYQKIIAAAITGSVAITVANPTDVVKVRL